MPVVHRVTWTDPDATWADLGAMWADWSVVYPTLRVDVAFTT